MKFKYLLAASVVSTARPWLPPAAAQSPARSISRLGHHRLGRPRPDVGGVEIPQTSKAKQVLGEEIIRRQRPGRRSTHRFRFRASVSVNDPWGSWAAASRTGFSYTRISNARRSPGTIWAITTLHQPQIDPEILDNETSTSALRRDPRPTASRSARLTFVREPEDYFDLTPIPTATCSRTILRRPSNSAVRNETLGSTGGPIIRIGFYAVMITP